MLRLIVQSVLHDTTSYREEPLLGEACHLLGQPECLFGC
jgi:hypothetical protein